jgi:hypothetical protein
LDDVTFLTNNGPHIRGLLPNSHKPIMGSLEVGDIETSTAVVYSQTEVPAGLTPQEFLIERLRFLQLFLQSVWLFKDNSVNPDLGFLLYSESGVPSVSSNSIAILYSTAEGDKSVVTTLSREDTRSIRNFLRTRMRADIDAERAGGTKLSHSTSRMERALYFCQIARSSSDIAIKISNYCSALEALYATNPAELSHQLSERVASFLIDNPAERLPVYKRVKEAYSIRSKIVHGASIKNSQLPALLNVSKACDDFLRQSLLKILADSTVASIFGGDSVRLDEYFLNRIFSIAE